MILGLKWAISFDCTIFGRQDQKFWNKRGSRNKKYNDFQSAILTKNVGRQIEWVAAALFLKQRFEY